MGIILQERDLELLRQLAVMSVADREQVKASAGFRSTTRANTRLVALVRAGVLRRFFLGAGGGRKAIYALAPKGAQLIGVPCRGPRRRQNETLIADLSLEHQLAVNAVYLALRSGHVSVPGVRFLNWISFHEPLAPSLRLIPDGYAEFATPSGTDCSFIEVDLGHEVLAVWTEKVRNYLQLAMSGVFADRFNQPRFRVLVLAPTERRLHSLRKATARLTHKVFWFATLTHVADGAIFAPEWFRPIGNTPQPLFEQPQ